MSKVLSSHRREIKDILATLAHSANATDFPDEDNLIAVTIVLKQISDSTDTPVTINDVIWAMDFMVHLDKFGREIAVKE